jgi:hypothetical protein
VHDFPPARRLPPHRVLKCIRGGLVREGLLAARVDSAEPADHCLFKPEGKAMSPLVPQLRKAATTR